MTRPQLTTTASIADMSQDTLQRIRHDLRGPVINIEGFLGELQEASKRLAALLQKYTAALPSEFSNDVADLLNNDVTPCIGFIDSSVAELNQRIDEVAQEFDVVLAYSQRRNRKC